MQKGRHLRNSITLSGILPIYKSKGMVSKDVSRVLEKRFGRFAKIGHAGTLDPMAEGVLPLLLGKATVLQDLLIAQKKSYDFSICLGVETDSLDATGNITRTAPVAKFPEVHLQEVLRRFKGEISQEPPLFSAVKYHGRPLYKHARSKQDQQVQLDMSQFARLVHIFRLEVLRHEDQVLELSVDCSKGTYVRSLARDIAAALGTCGHITAIKRTHACGINLDQCVLLEELATMDDLERHLVSIDKLQVEGLARMTLADGGLMQRLINGQKLVVHPQFFVHSLENISSNDVVSSGVQPTIFVSHEGRALGLGRAEHKNDGVHIAIQRGFV